MAEKIFSFKLRNPANASVSIMTQNPQFKLKMSPNSTSEPISGVYYNTVKPYVDAFNLEVIVLNPGQKAKTIEETPKETDQPAEKPETAESTPEEVKEAEAVKAADVPEVKEEPEVVEEKPRRRGRPPKVQPTESAE